MLTTRRPRLLFAVHGANLGGAQMVALGQAKYLADGHELVIPIGHGPLRARFAPFGRLIRRPVQLQIARSVLDTLRLAYVIKREGLDGVVVNSTVLVAPVAAARLAGVPSIVHV